MVEIIALQKRYERRTVSGSPMTRGFRNPYERVKNVIDRLVPDLEIKSGIKQVHKAVLLLHYFLVVKQESKAAAT